MDKEERRKQIAKEKKELIEQREKLRYKLNSLAIIFSPRFDFGFPYQVKIEIIKNVR